MSVQTKDTVHANEWQWKLRYMNHHATALERSAHRKFQCLGEVRLPGLRLKRACFLAQGASLPKECLKSKTRGWSDSLVYC